MTFLSKQDQLQPHFHSKARQLSTHIFVIKKFAIPAYSVTSLHFEHSVTPAAENVLAEHMVQLKEKVQV